MTYTEEENEAFYDDEMAPMLLKLAKMAEERGMAMIATVEFAPEMCGTTKVNLTSDVMKMMWLASQSRGNIDGVMIGWAKMAQLSGRDHGSIFLKQAGIELKAEDRLTS